MPSLVVIPCEIRHKWYTAENWILRATFHSQNAWCIFNHFYLIGAKSYQIWRNKANYMAMTPFRVIQGHRFLYQSRPPSGCQISELAAEFLSAEYQLFSHLKFFQISDCGSIPIESPYATSYYRLIVTYHLPCTFSKLWPIIGQIFSMDMGVSHFNARGGGDPVWILINFTSP